jgi:hypothetical protein
MIDSRTKIIEQQLKKYNIKRSYKYNYDGVGKVIGHNIWIHISAADLLPDKIKIEEVIERHADIITPTVIRYDPATNFIALIACDDFDASHEPTVGNSLLIKPEGSNLTKKGKNPLIYHHKWLMVRDSYNGFNVSIAMRRSLAWKSLMGANSKLSSKIGRTDFWNQWIMKENLDD